MVKKKDTAVGTILKTGLGAMVGIGLIGATSSMANSLPTGTAKTVVGIVPGLQAVSLVSSTAKQGKSLW